MFWDCRAPEPEHDLAVGGLSGRGDHFVAIRRNPCHPAQDRIEARRRAAVVVIGDQQQAPRTQLGQPVHAIFGAFNFDVDGARPRVPSSFEYSHLLLNAAVKTTVILAAPAGGQQDAIGMTGEKLADRPHASFRRGKVIQTEFKEPLAGLILNPSMAQQSFHIFEAKGNADLRKNWA